MTSAKRLGRAPRTIAIVRLLRGLGDMLCAVPALRAIRRAFPKAHIALIGLPSIHFFVARFSHYIDELIECPGYPGLPERVPALEQIPYFIDAMQERSFELVLQMHGNGSITNPLAALLRGGITAGFYVPGAYCPDPNRFLPYPEDRPEILRLLKLVEFLGIPSSGTAMEFPLWKDDRDALASIPELKDLWPRGYACLHPGANDAGKCWPPERFAQVADALSGMGIPVILTGSVAEAELARRVAMAMRRKPIDLAGRTTLGALAVLLSNARLLVCNDTGISHMAAALHVPSVVIFSNSDPERWAPIDRSIHRPVIASATVFESSFSCDWYSYGDNTARGREYARPQDRPVPAVDEVLAVTEELLLKDKFPWQRE